MVYGHFCRIEPPGYFFRQRGEIGSNSTANKGAKAKATCKFFTYTSKACEPELRPSETSSCAAE